MGSREIAAAIDGAKTYLRDHAEQARYRDSEAVAVVEDGLVVRVDGDGFSLRTDMVAAVGGTGSAASPGWLMRAAVASCIATLITMRAAEVGIVLANLRVSVDSESDDRGILGVRDDVPAGPFGMRVLVTADRADADEAVVHEVIEWAFVHCPVSDTVERAVPVERVVELR